MTAADIPYTPGQPDQGGEGYRFIGYQMYDALINWDLSQGERLPDLVPGLAESWEVSKADNTKWIFHLRRGVKFHDGSDFNADAAIWNLDRYFKSDAPQFDPTGGAIARGRECEKQHVKGEEQRRRRNQAVDPEPGPQAFREGKQLHEDVTHGAKRHAGRERDGHEGHRRSVSGRPLSRARPGSLPSDLRDGGGRHPARRRRGPHHQRRDGRGLYQ